MSSAEAQKHTVINEILPKAGLVYSEKGNLSEVMCKPKIMPLKSQTLRKLEDMDKRIREAAEAEEERKRDERDRAKKERERAAKAGSGKGVAVAVGGAAGGGGGSAQNVMSFD